MTDFRHPRASLRVVWTRGRGCGELAGMVASDMPYRVTGSLESAVVEQRADLLVARRLGPKALVSMATPVDFDPAAFDRVVAAVSGGPHSALATDIAARIGASIGIAARLISAYREPEQRPDAVATLYRMTEVAPGIDADVVEAKTPVDLLERIGGKSLLVLGAPGGSWLQRMFLGPGARLISAAPTGAVVVRRAPRRTYQVMEEPVYVSPMLGSYDAVRISQAEVLPVVDRGLLVGAVHRSALQMAGSGVTVGSLMKPAESVKATDSLLAVGDVAARQGGGPVPVVDDEGRLIGTVPTRAIRTGFGQ